MKSIQFKDYQCWYCLYSWCKSFPPANDGLIQFGMTFVKCNRGGVFLWHVKNLQLCYIYIFSLNCGILVKKIKDLHSQKNVIAKYDITFWGGFPPSHTFFPFSFYSSHTFAHFFQTSLPPQVWYHIWALPYVKVCFLSSWH